MDPDPWVAFLIGAGVGSLLTLAVDWGLRWLREKEEDILEED